MYNLDELTASTKTELASCKDVLGQLVSEHKSQSPEFQSLRLKEIELEKKLDYLQDTKKIEKNYCISNIPKKFWKTNDFKSPKLDVIHSAVTSGRNVYIFGKPGVGKTYLLAMYSKNLVHKDVSCSIRHIYNLQREIYKSKSFDYDKNDPLQDVKTVDVLILDDVGLEKPNEFMLSVLFEILEEREGSELPTVFISNFDQLKLMKRFTELTSNEEMVKAIMSRMFGNSKVIEMKGDDLRNKKKD